MLNKNLELGNMTKITQPIFFGRFGRGVAALPETKSSKDFPLVLSPFKICPRATFLLQYPAKSPDLELAGDYAGDLERDLVTLTMMAIDMNKQLSVFVFVHCFCSFSTLNEKILTQNEKFLTLNEKISTLNENFSTLNENFSTLNEKSSTLNENFLILNEKFSTLN